MECSQISMAIRPVLSSSSLLRIDCHFAAKTLTEWVREITEDMSSIPCRRFDFPADSPDELWSGFCSLIMVFTDFGENPFVFFNFCFYGNQIPVRWVRIFRRKMRISGEEGEMRETGTLWLSLLSYAWLYLLVAAETELDFSVNLQECPPRGPCNSDSSKSRDKGSSVIINVKRGFSTLWEVRILCLGLMCLSLVLVVCEWIW